MSVIGRETLLSIKDIIFNNQSYDLDNFELSSYSLRIAKKEILLNGQYYREYKSDQIEILPHQITFISTEEEIKLPSDLMGQVILRFGYSTKGLDLLAGHIDPLFEGRIVLALLNNSNSSIKLIPGDQIANLIIHQVAQDVLVTSESISNYKKKFTNIPQYIINEWDGINQPNLDLIVKQHSEGIKDLHNQIEVMNSTSQIVITGGIVLVATTILSVVLQVIFASWSTTSGWVTEAFLQGGKPELITLMLLVSPVITALIFGVFIYLIAKTAMKKKCPKSG